jgi:putative ABC transport system permease protein
MTRLPHGSRTHCPDRPDHGNGQPGLPPYPRLRGADLLPTGTSGLRSRRLRAALAALGISIGIAAVVAVLGITRSSQSDLLAKIDRLGTNLLTAANGQSPTGQEAELPATATAAIAHTSGVLRTAPTAELSSVNVYRTDLIPSYHSAGLAVRACDPSLLATLGGHLLTGVFLNDATARYPAVVLGYQAAQTLGIARLGSLTRVWLGGRWFTVTGILDPFGLAPELDESALIGFPVAAADFGYDGHPSRIYVRTDTTLTAQVASLLAPAASPENPNLVAVSRPSDALAARFAVTTSGTALFLGLGAVALLVGGIGIANVMVIAVLERRTEIGLRRALGAARRHIAAQFLTEAVALSAIGGLAGEALGTAATYAIAYNRSWQPLIPAPAIGAGLGTALAIGAIAGLYPAIRAAQLPPAEALRPI